MRSAHRSFYNIPIRFLPVYRLYTDKHPLMTSLDWGVYSLSDCKFHWVDFVYGFQVQKGYIRWLRYFSDHSRHPLRDEIVFHIHTDHRDCFRWYIHSFLQPVPIFRFARRYVPIWLKRPSGRVFPVYRPYTFLQACALPPISNPRRAGQWLSLWEYVRYMHLRAGWLLLPKVHHPKMSWGKST